MNRLINLLLIAGIALAVIASFAYLGLDLGEVCSATSVKQMGSSLEMLAFMLISP